MYGMKHNSAINHVKENTQTITPIHKSVNHTPLDTSTPLPQQSVRRFTTNIQGTPNITSLPELSPILPPTPGPINHTIPPLLSPLQPPATNPPPPTQQQETPLPKKGRVWEVESQVHIPSKVQPPKNNDQELETVSLNTPYNNTNISVITHDTISSICNSPKGRVGDQVN